MIYCKHQERMTITNEELTRILELVSRPPENPYAYGSGSITWSKDPLPDLPVFKQWENPITLECATVRAMAEELLAARAVIQVGVSGRNYGKSWSEYQLDDSDLKNYLHIRAKNEEEK